MHHDIEYDPRKFAELVLYVAQKSATDESFGATKLNKILFYSDFVAYDRRGRPITGARYKKLQYGPVPRVILDVQNALIRQQRAVLQNVETYAGHVQKRLVALDSPDLSTLTGEDIAIVDAVMESLRDMSATKVSDLSHNFSGWQLAELNEDIPYFTVCIPSEPLPLNREETAFARSVIETWLERAA